jgi:hypothetical protein
MVKAVSLQYTIGIDGLPYMSLRCPSPDRRETIMEVSKLSEPLPILSMSTSPTISDDSDHSDCARNFKVSELSESSFHQQDSTRTDLSLRKLR